MTIKKEFINRKDELKYLQTEFQKQDFRFISIIGRRRLGKTRFIQEFLKNKSEYCYFLVPELNDQDVRIELSKNIHRTYGISFIGIPSWSDIFEKLFIKSQDQQLILVFDEFQRFSEIDKTIFSIIQKFIDEYSKNSKLFLLISGSSIGMMQKILDYASPLYGRRTGQIYFAPLDFFALREWFPLYPVEKLVEIYAIYGGTPKYLEDVEHEDIITNIETILLKTSILYSEPEILIKTEISDSFTYFNILKHISQGVSRSSEIANCVGLKTTSIDYFLRVLINDMDLLKKEVPVTAQKRSKKTVYSIKDNLFRFWFKYIYPNLSEIEIGNTLYAREKIEKELRSFIGLSFEEISKQYLIELNRSNNMPFIFEKIGRQWGKYKGTTGKNTYEIDLTAINEATKDILFCECKWQNKKIELSVLEELIVKSGYVEWNNTNRKEHFMVISKSGFTKRAQVFAKENSFLLADIHSIDEYMTAKVLSSNK